MITKSSLGAWFGAAASEADFEALYRAELPRVYNFFRYRVGDEALAEDLTSETFEKAWRNRARYRRDLAAFSTWVFTIARRVAVDHYRRRRPTEPLETLNHLPHVETLEDLTQARAERERLRVLLARLADRERELVALKYGAGLTNRAIAGLTGLTESNVGVILHRTVQALRAEWEMTP
jgi:RNA polymerase sigma-70 factor (ECF subfamily)